MSTVSVVELTRHSESSSINDALYRAELRQLIDLEAAGQQEALDLRDVKLVNESAVKFLAGCKADSIKVESCPPIFEHELTTEEKVEEIGEENNQMRIATRADKQDR